MSNRVHCQSCGGRVDVPDGYARAKIRCPGCGYYAEVPPEMRAAADPVGQAVPDAAAPPRQAQPDLRDAAPPVARPARARPTAKPVGAKAKPQIDPRDHRPRFDMDDGPAGAPLLAGTQEESDDDVRPYTVPGTGLKPCPHCRGQLPLDAAFCVHCGKDLTSGAKAERSYQPIQREWEEGWSFTVRLQIFAVCMVLNVLAYVALAATDQSPPTVPMFLFQVGLQAFLLGSYSAFGVTRTARGKATLTLVRRIAFVKTQPAKLKWKGSQGVGVFATHAPGLLAWIILLYLVIEGVLFVGLAFAAPVTLGLAVVYFATAAGFYWFVVRPEQFSLALCDVYGSTDEVIFRSANHAQVREAAEVVSDATGLMYKRVM